jgi:hypothetical protein
MAILDYIPNIFGGAPTMYQGLLSPKDQAALQQRANLGGLLGFGAALAEGMSPQGYRRSALQNILSAAGAGFAGAGQTYESGINQMANVQKLQQSQAQIQAINQLLQDPRVASDPMMVAYIRANPAEAIKYFAEMAPIREALSPAAPVAPAVPVAAPVAQAAPVRAPNVPSVSNVPAAPDTGLMGQGLYLLEPSRDIGFTLDKNYQLDKMVGGLAGGMTPEIGLSRDATVGFDATEEMLPITTQPEAVPAVAPEVVPETNVLPGVTVTAAPPKVDPLMARKQELLAQNNRLSGIPSKTARDIIDNNIKQIETLDKQISRRSVEEFDFGTIKDTVPERFKSEVDDLQQLALSGAITGNELRQGLQDINKRATEFVTKKTDYTNQDRRVAAGMFQGRPIEDLTPVELMQLENKLYEMRIAERKAGATNINMPTESERTAGFLTNRVVNSLNQLQSVVGATPTAASPNFGAEAVRFLTGSEYLKNLANPESRQQVEAAQLEILDAALTLGTGAAYTREQLENYRRSYFPQLGDKAKTVQDKQQRLKSLIDSAMIKSGRAAPGMPSGMNAPAFDANAIQMELDRRKGK